MHLYTGRRNRRTKERWDTKARTVLIAALPKQAGIQRYNMPILPQVPEKKNGIRYFRMPSGINRQMTVPR